MNTILEIKNLNKAYGKNQVLEDVSFHLEQGQILGLLGRNGAGKTTLMKTILGLNARFSGSVLFHGKDLDFSSSIIKKKIGSLVDLAFYDELTAYQNLKLLLIMDEKLSSKDVNYKIDNALSLVDLSSAKNKKVKTFSFGMKQRLALAQTFIKEPDILILDEPFVGLDPIGIEEIKKLLKEYCKSNNTAIIFSSHQIADIEGLADYIMVLKDGMISEYDTYDNLIERKGSLINLFK